jgi:hypothetical protein
MLSDPATTHGDPQSVNTRNRHLLAVLLSLTLARQVASVQTIACNRFAPRAILASNQLLVSLDTDLPDSTEVMVSVSRSYWAGHPIGEYPIEYLDTNSTVREWRKPRRVSLDNAAWKRKLEERLLTLARMGQPIKVARVDRTITVAFVVPINQPDPRFGIRNKNLVGTMVSTSGLRTINAEQKVAYPIGKVAHSSSAKFGNSENLRIGSTYRLSRETPLAPEPYPADPLQAISEIRRIPRDSTITVLNVDRSEPPYPWYRVKAATASGAQLGNGWVNGLALIGQELRVVSR